MEHSSSLNDFAMKVKFLARLNSYLNSAIEPKAWRTRGTKQTTLEFCGQEDLSDHIMLEWLIECAQKPV